MLTTLAALFALLFGFTSTATPAFEATPASAAVQHLEEDEAGWDCATMGNGVCGQAVNDLPACAEEDSNGPCHWDATARGNGMGDSFTVDANNVVTYLSAATL